MTPGNSSSQWKLFRYCGGQTNQRIIEFCGRRGSRNHLGRSFPVPLPKCCNLYVEDGVDRLHGKIFLHFDYEEIDHLLIRLKEVDGIVAFTDEYFAFLAGYELEEFFVDDGGVSKFEGAVDE